MASVSAGYAATCGRARAGGSARSGARALIAAGTVALLLGAAACSSGNNNTAGNTAAKSATTGGAASVATARTATTVVSGTPARPGTPLAGTAAARGAPTGTPNAALAAVPSVTITAKDFSFDAPASIPAGLTRLHLQNSGKEEHQAQLVRLNPGVTLPQVQAALQQGPDSALRLVTVAGGPNAAPPGGTADVIDDLQPGQYLLLCFVSGADNIPHVAKGMLKPLQVTGGTPAVAAQLPAAQAMVTLREFSFTAPATLPSGQTVVKVTNSGTQPHELTVVKLNGITAEQLKSALGNANATPPPGPPPFSAVGGLGAIAPGTSGEALLTLTPGNYALLCFVPDPATGKPHAAEGMVQGFSVK